MDELSEKLDKLLSSPDLLDQVRSVMQSLPADPSPTLPALPSSESPPDMTSFLKIAPMLSDTVKDDDNTRLLKALRPYLSPARASRLDEAVQILRLIRLLPMLSSYGKEKDRHD